MDPDKIVLFSSHARASAHEDSDIDLLILKPTPLPRRRRAIPARRALAGLNVSAEILGRTPEEIAGARERPWHVVARALCEGQTGYAGRVGFSPHGTSVSPSVALAETGAQVESPAHGVNQDERQ